MHTTGGRGYSKMGRVKQTSFMVCITSGLVLLTSCDSTITSQGYSEKGFAKVMIGASKEDVLDAVGEPLARWMVGETSIAYYTRSQVLEGSDKNVGESEKPEGLFEEQSDSTAMLFFDAAGNLSGASPEIRQVLQV